MSVMIAQSTYSTGVDGIRRGDRRTAGRARASFPIPARRRSKSPPTPAISAPRFSIFHALRTLVGAELQVTAALNYH